MKLLSSVHWVMILVLKHNMRRYWRSSSQFNKLEVCLLEFDVHTNKLDCLHFLWPINPIANSRLPLCFSEEKKCYENLRKNTGAAEVALHIIISNLFGISNRKKFHAISGVCVANTVAFRVQYMLKKLHYQAYLCMMCSWEDRVELRWVIVAMFALIFSLRSFSNQCWFVARMNQCFTNHFLSNPLNKITMCKKCRPKHLCFPGVYWRDADAVVVATQGWNKMALKTVGDAFTAL